MPYTIFSSFVRLAFFLFIRTPCLNHGPRTFSFLHALLPLPFPSRVSSLATVSVHRSTLWPLPRLLLSPDSGTRSLSYSVDGGGGAQPLQGLPSRSFSLDLVRDNCTLRSSRLVREEFQSHGLFPLFSLLNNIFKLQNIIPFIHREFELIQL